MQLSDADLDFLLNIYSSAKGLIPVKDRPDWAFQFIQALTDEGIELKLNSETLVDACPYLDKAMDIVLEEHDEEDWEIDQDDEWE